MTSPWLTPPLCRTHDEGANIGEQTSSKASQALVFGQMAHHDGAGPVTANSPGTVASTTSPGRRVECAITDAIATNLSCNCVGGPRMKVTGVVMINVTTPWSSSLMIETWALKAGGSWDAT